MTDTLQLLRLGRGNGYRVALEAAAQHRTESVAELLVEALWDCDPASRILTCEAVPLDEPGVVDRIRELSEDSLEDVAVRRAAAERRRRSKF